MYASLNPGLVGIKASLTESFMLAQRHGFGGLDVQINQLHDAVSQRSVAAVRDLFTEHKLRPGTWNLPFKPYTLTKAKWQDALAKLPPLLATAQALGATRAGMWILPGSYDRSYAQNFTFHVERFQPVARLLADYGIRLGLEFLGPETLCRIFKHPFIRSVAQTRELARVIGSNCGQLFDNYHWHCAGGTRADLAELTREEIVSVHLSDAPAGVELAKQFTGVRKLPGTTGEIDLAGFMQAMADAGYDGPLTAQPCEAGLSALPADESAARTAHAIHTAIATTQCPT